MAIIKKTEGHLTITDLTDVADVYFEYALALKNALVTNEYTFSETGEIGWSKAYPTWNPGYQIWKRQVKLTERAEQEQYVFQTSATTTYTDGAYVRVHGYDIEKNYVEQLYQFLIRPDTVVPLTANFNLPSNIQFIRISYPKTGLNNTSFVQGDTPSISGTGLIDINTNENGSITTGGNTTSNSSFTHTDYIPICIVTYGTPNLDTAVNQINNSITNINGNLINLDTKLETFFWPGDSTYSGAFAVAKTVEDGIDYTNANTYGFNTRVATGLVSIGYNKIPLSEWGIVEGLKMYYPILDNGEVVGNQLGMQLTAEGIDIYNPNGIKGLDIKDNGLTIYSIENSSETESSSIHPIVAIKQDIFTLGFDLTELTEDFDPYSDGNEEPFIVWKKDGGNTYLYEYLDDIIIKDSNGRYALKEKINTIEQNIATNTTNIININGEINNINNNIYDITSQLNKAKNDISTNADNISINADNISTNVSNISLINARINKIKAYWTINNANNHLKLIEGGL